MKTWIRASKSSGIQWNRIVAIRESRTERNSPRILTGCWCNGDTRINQGRPLPADEKLRNDGLDHQAGRATRLRFTGIVRGMLTVSGIQIVSIAATRDNSSLHHAHGDECKYQSVKPGAHVQCRPAWKSASFVPFAGVRSR